LERKDEELNPRTVNRGAQTASRGSAALSVRSFRQRQGPARAIAGGWARSCRTQDTRVCTGSGEGSRQGREPVLRQPVVIIVSHPRSGILNEYNESLESVNPDAVTPELLGTILEHALFYFLHSPIEP
jgi:hypothetical protein